MEIIIFIGVLSMLGFISRSKKHVSPERIQRQNADNELITVILPTINNEK